MARGKSSGKVVYKGITAHVEDSTEAQMLRLMGEEINEMDERLARLLANGGKADPIVVGEGQFLETPTAFWGLRVHVDGYTGPVVQMFDANSHDGNDYTYVDVYENELNNYLITPSELNDASEPSLEWCVMRIYDQVGNQDLVFDAQEYFNINATWPTFGPRILFNNGAYTVQALRPPYGMKTETGMRIDEFGVVGVWNATTSRDTLFGADGGTGAPYQQFALVQWNDANVINNCYFGEGVQGGRDGSFQTLNAADVATTFENTPVLRGSRGGRVAMAISRDPDEGRFFDGSNKMSRVLGPSVTADSTELYPVGMNFDAYNNNDTTGLVAVAYYNGESLTLDELESRAYRLNAAVGTRTVQEVYAEETNPPVDPEQSPVGGTGLTISELVAFYENNDPNAVYQIAYPNIIHMDDIDDVGVETWGPNGYQAILSSGVLSPGPAPSNILHVAEVDTVVDPQYLKTLVNNNEFGNKHRFTYDDGTEATEVYTNSPVTIDNNATLAGYTGSNPRYIIDHYTGLGWYRSTYQSGGTATSVEWYDARGMYDYYTDLQDWVDKPSTFTYGGFTDWRRPTGPEWTFGIGSVDWSNYMSGNDQSARDIYFPPLNQYSRGYGAILMLLGPTDINNENLTTAFNWFVPATQTNGGLLTGIAKGTLDVRFAEGTNSTYSPLLCRRHYDNR